MEASGERRRQLHLNVVWVAERQNVNAERRQFPDLAVRDAVLVEPGTRLLEFGSIRNAEAQVIKADSVSIEYGLMLTPSAICTSVTRGPSGVKTVPPRRMRSVKRQVGDAKER